MELIWQSPPDVSPLCPTGDSQKDRPRRLTEHRWHPEPQDGDWGKPSPNSTGRMGGW